MVTTAAMICGLLASFEIQLNAQYGETLFSIGVIEGGISIMRLYVDPDDRSWTAVMQNGAGACIMTSGNRFETARPEKRQKIILGTFAR